MLQRTALATAVLALVILPTLEAATQTTIAYMEQIPVQNGKTKIGSDSSGTVGLSGV
jgi:hypothetical protein